MLHSNPPWLGSGYGNQCGLLAPRLAAAGHDVVISALTGQIGRTTTWEGITVLPSGYTSYSNDVVAGHAKTFFGNGPGLVLGIYDAWVVDAQQLQGLATAIWSPVHSVPVNAGDRLFYALTGAQPIAMSQFGAAQLRRSGMQPVYVPHGVDTAVFRPLDDGDRADARRILGVPEDAFLVVMVAANKSSGNEPPRKGWGEAFQAFARLAARHPDAVLYCHTIAASPHGINLEAIARDLGLEKRVIFSPDYAQVTGLFTDHFIAGLQGCADVVLNPSWAEGFGLGIVQAQAAGTPVIVGDNSAQTELCGAGWKAECQPYWYPGDMAWWHVPLISSVALALEEAYEHRGDTALRAQAREFAEGYDADQVMARYWRPALAMLEQYAGAAPVRLPEPGAVPLPTDEADGLRWVKRGSHTDDWIAFRHEDTLAPLLDELMPEGGVLADVGAHVGRWSLRLARKASRVIAIEPSPQTAAVLRYHIAVNEITNVEVHQLAAWDSYAQLRLEDPNHRVTGGSAHAEPDPDGLVQGLPLDSLLDGEPQIDLIKMDVEGADLHALRGLAGTLKRCQPVLFIEDHSIYGYYRRDELTALLESLGYAWQLHVAVLPGGASAPYVIARPES